MKIELVFRPPEHMDWSLLNFCKHSMTDIISAMQALSLLLFDTSLTRFFKARLFTIWKAQSGSQCFIYTYCIV